MSDTSTSPRLTIEEINQFNPSPERPLEVECDDGHYKEKRKKVAIISRFNCGNAKVRSLSEPCHSLLFGFDNSDLAHYPSIKHLLWDGTFQVGDKVSAFGVTGEVRAVDGEGQNKPILTMMDNYGLWNRFTADGRLETWHKQPSLTFISRPVRKVAKKFWLWSHKETGQISDYVLDENGNTPTGKTVPFGRCSMEKIPGTEVTLEVEVGKGEVKHEGK